MRRRSSLPVLLLLSTVWAWLGFDIACGARAAGRFQPDPTPAQDGCCHQAPKDDACTTPGCGLTCAALLTVSLSESGLDLAPAFQVSSWLLQDEFAPAVPRCPPVPPPRGVA